MVKKHRGEPLPPFLARFHADLFRVSMGLASQAVLWSRLSSVWFADPWPMMFNLTLGRTFWFLATMVLASSFFAYLFKCIFYFDIVRAEFSDRWRVNYLFAPWIASILLLQCVLPPKYYRWKGDHLEGVRILWVHPNPTLSRVIWGAFTVPILLLELKIYGQWFTKGRGFLSTVANPSTNLSLIANFISAHTAAQLAMIEPGMFLFAIGIIHYVVVFVTLYQRLPFNASCPAQLRPVSFLSIAAPSVACVAWGSISGSFDSGCKMLHFLSLFLFISLAVRPTLFMKAMKKFNSAWWAYVLPVTMLALSSTEYAEEVQTGLAYFLRRSISIISMVMTLSLIVLTVIRWKVMFVDDTRLFHHGKMTAPLALSCSSMKGEMIFSPSPTT